MGDKPQEVIRMDTNRLNGFFWGLLFIVVSISSAPVFASGEAGVLSYSGVISGKVVFDSSDCTPLPLNGSNIVSFQAPSEAKIRYRNGYPVGPELLFVTNQYGIAFNPGDGQQPFIGAKQDTNVSWKNNDGQWVVTFKNARVPRINKGDQPEFVFLSGVLTCTNNETKNAYEGKE
ncbi:MAG: hypothetical protein B7X28_00165 [Halothiobacillus sp. 13-55-253]|jgi:hypothetical protein|nr:MAG: hypothetical protein B7X28_00165 [Halothiobacillus sp. 13-55-253]